MGFTGGGNQDQSNRTNVASQLAKCYAVFASFQYTFTKRNSFYIAAADASLAPHLKLWATAVAIAFMTTFLEDLQDDWQLMCNKAKQALAGELAKTKVALTLDALLASAEKYIKGLKN